MKQKLRQLSEASKALEPGPEERQQLQKLANDYGNEFLSTLSEQPAFTPFDKQVNDLLHEPITEDGQKPGDVLKLIKEKVVPPGLNLASGRHFGYIPGGGLSTAAIGDYLAAITNRYAGIYSSSPGAAALETRLVNWLCNLFGYKNGSGGYLASGGSHANLTAVVTARDDAGLKSADYSKAVVYITQQTHHCIDRALNIAGMNECVRKSIPMDSQFRMIPGKLEEAINEDLKNRLIPWLIVASAGSTDTGAIDPLPQIAPIAKRHNLWFHVDAAYGGFFMLTEEGKTKLKGIEESDSVVIDPHKGLFLPYGTGVLLVKNVDKLAWSHRFSANYMNDTRIDAGMYSPAEISPELSKHFRALRMWLPLKIHGIGAFRSALEEKLLLAEYLWSELQKMDEIETGLKPQLSVLMFRWKPEHEEIDVNELNRTLHRALLADGRVFLSTTVIDGQLYFRAAILSVRSHLGEIETLIDVLKEKMKEVLIMQK